ncbi:B3 domain-containing protein At1g05920-like [Musa acuminata AAA Group]|uniref:B3 domain-containing protein At1g05920-like n=1 Tax=Musa acuminata AAA Group TaxID=214697 RepID=UPI0031E30FD7
MEKGSSSKRKTIDDDFDDILVMPEWVITLVTKQGGTDARFIGTKLIEKFDFDVLNKRLHPPKRLVGAKLMPMLTEFEKAAARLSDDVGVVKEPGLQVTVFTRCGFRCENLELTRNDISGWTVIKGTEMQVFSAWSSLEKGDEVEIWGFRREDKLCFAIGKSASPNILKLLANFGFSTSHK